MRASDQPTVFVLDDDGEVRRALGRLLASAGYRVELFSSAFQFLEQAAGDRPGCLVIDLRLPGLNGIDLLNLLRTTGRSMPLVFITGYGDVPTSVQAMKAGAVDFLTKPVNDDDLLAAVERALARDVELRAERTERMELRNRVATLTPREKQVFELVVQGLPNKQIAGKLGTSEQTIKVHRGRMMHKMQADSIAHLVHLADRLDSGEKLAVKLEQSGRPAAEPAPLRYPEAG
jgi:RNA polymerase sigma factor (sigma-70 family)